jgi:hypothetical protein
MINPAGHTFTLPTGLFTLSAFGQELEFGQVIGKLRDLLRKIESTMDGHIRAQVEEQAKSPEEIDQAMKGSGGGLILVASISFEKGEENSDIESSPG